MNTSMIALAFIYKMLILWAAPLMLIIMGALVIQFVLYRFYKINLYKIITKKLF